MRFSKNDILDALGVEHESESDWIVHSLAGFGVGCLVGAAVAILLAPKSGRELREDIAERGRDLINRGKEVSREFTGEGGKTTNPTF